jgi:hypothetical protein
VNSLRLTYALREFGALVTGVVLLIVATTNAFEGASIVIVMIPRRGDTAPRAGRRNDCGDSHPTTLRSRGHGHVRPRMNNTAHLSFAPIVSAT